MCMHKSILGLGLVLLSGAALANQTVIQARASLSPGLYDFGISVPGLGSASGDGSIIAADTGFSAIFVQANGGAVLSDIELEYMDIDVSGSGGGSFNRTDLKLTTGYQFPSRITPIVGYRFAAQGDGFFNDDNYQETGFFVGVGYSGIKLGDFGSLGGSLAYNATELEFPDGSKLDADGGSARVSVSLNEIPLSIGLRYQTFDISESTFNFDESYFLLSFTYTFFSRVLGAE